MSLELQSLLPYPNSCVGSSPHQQGRDTKMLSFCGIDVSKDRLDVMVLLEEQCCSVPNDAGGWAALVERGTVRTTKLKEGWYFAGNLFGLADSFQHSVRQPGSGPNVVVHEQELAEQAAHREPVLVEVLQPPGVHKLVAQKPDDGADQNCLSVVAAAEQDHDEG
jgi:hypothetical protein